VTVTTVLQQGAARKVTCTCSFLEIYNEAITDLLNPSETHLHIREAGSGTTYVENLSQEEVSSGEQQSSIQPLCMVPWNALMKVKTHAYRDSKYWKSLCIMCAIQCTIRSVCNGCVQSLC
jgi:hypothetical protein